MTSYNRIVDESIELKSPVLFHTKNTAGPADTAGRLPYGDRPGQKDGSGKEPVMKLQWIKDILGDVYTEDIDAKVCTALGERFVARADFNDKTAKLKEAETQSEPA